MQHQNNLQFHTKYRLTCTSKDEHLHFISQYNISFILIYNIVTFAAPFFRINNLNFAILNRKKAVSLSQKLYVRTAEPSPILKYSIAIVQDYEAFPFQ